VWRDAQCDVTEGSHGTAPSIVRDYDELVKLALDEEQAYILTFVDGVSTVDTIATRSGLPREHVGAILSALLGLGAIDVPAA
jgi:hypothetical protein